MEKYCVFVTQGGMGKQIASTAVAEAIKNNHPDRKLVIVSSYPEVYINNPHVHRVFRLGATPYFYKDYIYEKDTIVFNGEPYFTADHIHKRKHLILNWCDLFKIVYNGERPKLFFNQLENGYYLLMVDQFVFYKQMAGLLIAINLIAGLEIYHQTRHKRL